MNDSCRFLRAFSARRGSRRKIALALALAHLPGLGWSHPGHTGAPIAPWLAALAPSPSSSATAAAMLSVNIVDAQHGEPAAVRVRITDEAGRPFGLPVGTNLAVAQETRLAAPGTVPGLPAQAIGIMYGQNDVAQGYAFQQDGAFFVKGAFELPMPAGTFFLTLTKGNEYIRLRERLVFQPGDHLKRTYRLERWVNMPQLGWYSADDHIHLRRSPRENPLILDWIAAEDVHVGVLLQMGDFWTTYFSQYAWGKAGRYGPGQYVLLSGQEEPRTNELGHTISFGAEQFVRYREDYFSYDKLFDRIHQLGGVSGYAHQGMSFHGYRGMTLDVLAGKIDFLELAQFCVPEGPLAVEHYYHFLDLGYRLTALAGSDFPWCGLGRRPGEEQVGAQIGNARFYTYVGEPFSYDRWFSAVKAGHTFVSTGPVVELEVNGQRPGTTLDVKAGTKLRISARALGHATDVPLQRLQIIGHGKVLGEAKAGQPGQRTERLTLEFEVGAEHGIWLAARADAGVSQTCHTTPVYVTVNGDGFHNRATLAARIDQSRRYLEEIRALLRPPTAPAGTTSSRVAPGPATYPSSRDHLEKRITEAEAKLAALRTKG
jgi:hypothetical protein